MDLLDKKRKILHGFNDLLSMFREIESIGVEMKEMEVSRLFCKLLCLTVTVKGKGCYDHFLQGQGRVLTCFFQSLSLLRLCVDKPPKSVIWPMQSYLSCCRVSPPFGSYHIVWLGERGHKGVSRIVM